MLKDVLLLSACPPPAGGIATWTQEYLDYCSKYSYTVDMVNIAMTGSRRDRVVNGKRNIIDEFFRTRDILRNIRRAYRSDKYRICHINSSCSKFGILRDYISVRIAKKHDSKVFFHCHCHVPTQIKSKLLGKIFKKICYYSDGVIVLNQLSRHFAEQFGAKFIYLIPNFIDIDKQYDRIKIEQEIHTILYVGHVIKQKGIDIILQVAQKHENLEFLLVGPIDDEYANVILPFNVKMLGTKKHDEVYEYIKHSDLFLFPSFSEGFSISLLEAMYYGLPIIASNVGANRDMLEDKGGVVLEITDCSSISNALSMLEDPQIRESMSAWNYSRVKELYSKNNVLNTLFQLYEKEV